MDKEALFKPRLVEREVPLDGFPEPLRIRALSRDEMAELREEFSDDSGELEDRRGFEYALISAAMVDPELSPEEVQLWAKAAPGGELIKVLTEVNSLSGLDDVDGAKSVRPNRQQRRAALRARSRA